MPHTKKIIRKINPNLRITHKKSIPSFTKPKFQLSSIKEVYKQQLSINDLYKLLCSNKNWNYLEIFLKHLEKNNKIIKTYGMCFTTKNLKNNNLLFQVLYGNMGALETLDKSLLLRGKPNCSLKNYRDINSKKIYKYCRKGWVQKNNNDFYIYDIGTQVILPNIKKFNISQISDAYSFMKNIEAKKRHKFWNLVGNTLKKEIDKNKNKVGLTIHIGPCHQQGTPVFHVKIGTNVTKCLVGNHIKSLNKKNCTSKYGKVWNDNHEEEWLVDIIKPEKM